MQRRAPNPDAKTATMSQERLTAIENGTIFTVPERGTDDIVDIHFIIEGDWAATIDASAWNIWSYTDAAYLWPVNTPIAAYEIQDIVVGLEGGQDYAVELFDPDFGDGGISGNVSYDENGAPIVSWNFYDWSGTYGYFDFFVFDHLTMASNPSPADQEIDVLAGLIALTWTQGEGVEDMQVLFGTEYPPTEIALDWGSGIVTSIPVDVDYNLQYFWQVNYTNPLGTLDGDVWGFTTEIMVPGNVMAEQQQDFSVRVSWESSIVMPPPARALIGYNIFEGGLQIATEVPGDSYIVTNPTYDMNVGTCYQVQAVFDEGVSDLSVCGPNSVILVNGTGMLEGNVTELGTGDPLALAMIHATGTDPDMDVWEYDFESTIPFGYYAGDVVAGTYDFMVTLDQYEDLEVLGVAVPYGVTTVQDFVLTPWGPPVCADTPYPADTEQDINANNLTLTWNLDEVRTDEYRILFDTEYPPMDVLVDWTAAAESYALPGALDPNMQYFWQVQVRNSWGEVTNCDIWGFTTTITVPGDLTATVMDIDDVLLEWTSSEQQEREFIEYVVYRDAAEIARTTDTEYLDEDLAYNPTTCYSYQVEAIFDEGTSDMSGTAEACITGMGMVDGYVMSLLTSDPIEGATVALDGMGELGDPFTYTFTTDVDGYYEGEVMVGNYDYEVSAMGYITAFANDDVAYDTYTTNDFYLDEEPYPVDEVIATELNDDEAHLEWGFDASREIEDYSVYRGLWDDDFMDMTYVGNTTQNQFIDYDWGMQTSGVYKWAVVVNYTNNSSVPTYSNFLDKDMETIVNVDVTLNSAESPEGTEITLVNVSEPYLMLEYSLTMDATGMASIDPIRKGDYEIEVSLFGYATVYDIQAIYDETDLSYLLYEQIVNPTNLYVNPNGFATWDMPTAGGLDMYVADFEGGIPATIIVDEGPGTKWWIADASGYVGAGARAPWGYDIDTRMTTPKVELDGTTVVQFAWSGSYYWNVSPYPNGDLTIEISFNEGLTWTEIWSFHDIGVWSSFTWYETTIDLAALGYTSGDAIFSAHIVADDNGDIELDEWYIGPATVASGTVAISTPADVEESTRELASGSNVEMLANNLLAPAASVDANRELQSFKVWLDDVLSGEPTETMWDYEANEALVEGQTYHAEVAAVFTTGISDKAEYYFTYYPCTHFDGPASVTADVVVGTMDVLVSWSAVASNVPGDDVMGVNIFRDGELIAMVPVGTEFYVDEQLSAADYEYCITNVYDSEAQSCQVCDMVTVTPGGYVNGYVTEFASGDPIEGATVALNGATDSYVFTTDEMGYYEGEVVAGTYDYTASAATYQTEMLEDVFIDFAVTVSQDFQLKEYPYPVGEVIATEINDNSVLVNWSGQGGSVSEWLVYDDDVQRYGGIGAEAADYSLIWASKWVPAQLTEYGTGYVTKVSVYQMAAVGDYVTEVRVMSGDGSTILYSQDVTGEMVADTWNVIELDDAVEFDNTDNLWIGMYVERPGGTFNEPIASNITGTIDRCDMWAYNDGPFITALDTYGITAAAWMLRGYVSTSPGGKEVALDQGDFNTTGHKDYSNAPSVPTGNAMMAVTKPNTRFPLNINDSEREIVGYNVYAGPCDGDEGDMTFIGFTLDQTYTDNTWAVAEPGIYKWAVEVVYDFNASEFAFSNCLDKDMETTVTVEVTTNSGDSPEGTDVVFTNVSEMADPPIVFETELDASGIYTWTDFRKGTYDIYVHLNGFADIMVEDVYIWDEAYFEWMLEELLAPPSDLYVTPMGYATWTPGGVVPFEPFLEDFNEGLPDTWTVIDGGSNAFTWTWLTDDAGNTLDDTPFMMADSDAAGIGSTMDEQLISPVIEFTENADALYVEFDYIYQNLSSTNEYFAVDVYDGDDWVEVFYTITDSGPFPWGPTVHEMIDVTEYANPDFQVRFHYVSGGWNWYVAVDNIAVTEGDSKYADRMVEYYKVWHESTFVTDRDTTFYQYGDNGEVLVPYETYHAEVATVFSTGISPKSEYFWTYIPCEDFPGPAQFTAEHVDGTMDVLLTWSDIVPMELVFVTQNPGTPSNGYFQFYDNGYGVVYDLSAYPDALANSIEFHHASWGVSGPHDYNIHIIDWDAETVIATLGPFITTGDDQWEMDIELGDVDLMGAENVAFLMEPLSNSATDAYPDLSSDDASSPQGSVYGPLDDIGSIGASTIGNFLMNIYIMTGYGEVKISSTALDIPAGPAATPRVGEGNTVFETIITNQTSVRGGDDDPLVGANLYRDGEMIAFVELPDTSYLDMDLAAGYYDYCIAYLYESGAHSCIDGMCVEQVLVPEDCDVPQNLTAEVDGADPNLVHLLWDQGTGIAEWLFYDDGTNVDGIGGPAIFHWAIKFDPAQLTPYDGTSVTKISLYCRTAPVNTLQIFEGTGAETLIHEQDLVGLTIEAWNEVPLDSPVLIDVTKELWITVYTEDGANYPAACGPTQNEPNGDLISQDGGATWDHLSDFSLPYTWNLRCYVEDAKGAQKPLALENDKVYNTTSSTVAASGVVNTSEGAVLNMTDASREWLGYNIYKDGELLEALWPDNFYDDTEYQLGDYCYTVTSEYSICGESDPSNEACIEIIIGVNELDATEANLYPNPARDQITITALEMNRLHIVNYVGQVVYDQEFDSSNSKSLNTANYQSGVYVARIYTEKGVITKRFVINR